MDKLIVHFQDMQPEVLEQAQEVSLRIATPQLAPKP